MEAGGRRGTRQDNRTSGGYQRHTPGSRSRLKEKLAYSSKCLETGVLGRSLPTRQIFANACTFSFGVLGLYM
jgi:hypothetical protein